MRQHSRLTFRHLGRVQVTSRLNGEPMGYVADLSLGGLRLIGSQPLEVGGRHEMCLHVPDHRDKLREVDVSVVCQWVRRTPRRDSFTMGFALDGASQAFVDLVAEMLPRRS